MNSKAASERYQRQVGDLAKLPGNDVCADCGGRMPRWASWSLGIFICVNCAAIHRKMGTHISKVKSLTLDTWTKEQVESMRAMGNVKSNQKFNPDERRHRPPVSVDDTERSSELERYIFDKYRGKFMASAAPKQVSIPYGQNAPPLPSKSLRDTRGAMSTLSNGRETQRRPEGRASPPPYVPPPASVASSSTPQIPPRPRGASTGVSSALAPAASSSASTSAHSLAPPTATLPPRSSSANAPTSPPPTQTSSATAQSSVFDDLMSLGQPLPPQQQHPQFAMHMQMPVQNPAQQMNPWAHLAMQQQAVVSPMVMSHSPYAQQQQQVTGMNGASPSYLGHSPSNLGTMAFASPAGASPGYLSASPYFGSNGSAASPHSAQMLGQSAFLSPFQAQQAQFATSAPSGNGFANGHTSPGFATPGHSTPSSANPFGQFASSMMPGSNNTQQQAQTYARGWPGTKQNNPWA